MKKLKRLLKSKEDVSNLINILISRIKEGEFNSLDGFVIGLIYANSKFIATLFLSDDKLPAMSDNSIQQLEQCIIWFTNNEDKIIEIYKKYEKIRNINPN